MTSRNNTIQHSLVIPVYKNEENILDLLAELNSLTSSLEDTLEVIFVVDGSPDRSYLILANELPSCQFSSQLINLSRNFGSFAAIRQGMQYCRGEYIAVMAADLQEPVSLINTFFISLKEEEVDVVFGVRTGRSDGFMSNMCSKIFWSLYRKFIIHDVPRGGVDIFGCNQRVNQSVLQISEPNSSLIAQLFWVGFRRKFVPYKRHPRQKGKSAWKFSSKIRYMFDSLFSFSDLPIMLLIWLGSLGVVSSLSIGTITFFAWVNGNINVAGYTTMILLQVFFASLLLLSQGIIGAYLWRAFENTKKRPLSIVNLHSYITPKSNNEL